MTATTGTATTTLIFLAGFNTLQAAFLIGVTLAVLALLYSHR